MEGLIPMAFKAIKKNRTRRHYECLYPTSSSSSSLLGTAAHSSYQHQSVFANKNKVSAASAGINHQQHPMNNPPHSPSLMRPGPAPAEGKVHHLHRRHHTAIGTHLHLHHHQDHKSSCDDGINSYSYGIGGSDYNDPPHDIYDAVMHQQQCHHPTIRKQLVRFSSHKLLSCVTGATH